MKHEPETTATPRALTWLTVLGFAFLIVLSLGPLLLERRPVTFVPPHQSAVLWWGSKGLVLLLMVLAIALRTWADRRSGQRAVRRNVALFFLAGVMAFWHWFAVDTRRTEVRPDVRVEVWQRRVYLQILNVGDADAPGPLIPHGFRPLPYGFVRFLERITGDWRFSCLSYRWFFSFWLLWGCYQFISLFHDSRRAWLGTAVVLILYPLSVMYYWGQLTDPLSHALFVLALICVVQDRWIELAVALALGVMAKETAVIVVPAYWACCWRGGLPVLGKTTVLGLACVAAFLAVRLPLGWTPGLGSLNGTKDLMILTNLGLSKPLYRSPAPLSAEYLHPLLFVGAFVPLMMLCWRQIDVRLRVLVLILTPLVLVSSLCFSWLHESRNYVPLLPVLAAASLPPRTKR